MAFPELPDDRRARPRRYRGSDAPERPGRRRAPEAPPPAAAHGGAGSEQDWLLGAALQHGVPARTDDPAEQESYGVRTRHADPEPGDDRPGRYRNGYGTVAGERRARHGSGRNGAAPGPDANPDGHHSSYGAAEGPARNGHQPPRAAGGGPSHGPEGSAADGADSLRARYAGRLGEGGATGTGGRRRAEDRSWPPAGRARRDDAEPGRSRRADDGGDARPRRARPEIDEPRPGRPRHPEAGEPRPARTGSHRRERGPADAPPRGPGAEPRIGHRPVDAPGRSGGPVTGRRAGPEQPRGFDPAAGAGHQDGHPRRAGRADRPDGGYIRPGAVERSLPQVPDGPPRRRAAGSGIPARSAPPEGRHGADAAAPAAYDDSARRRPAGPEFRSGPAVPATAGPVAPTARPAAPPPGRVPSAPLPRSPLPPEETTVFGGPPAPARVPQHGAPPADEGYAPVDEGFDESGEAGSVEPGRRRARRPVPDVPEPADQDLDEQPEEASADEGTAEPPAGRRGGPSGIAGRIAALTGRSKATQGEDGEKRQLAFWKEMLLLAGVALLLTVLIQTFLAKVYVIPSGSMETTLHGCTGCTNDRVLVDKVTYNFTDISPGDIVVFRGTDGWSAEGSTAGGGSANPLLRGLETIGSLVGFAPPDEKDFVKRVIAVGGQTVACCDALNQVMVDGQPLEEPYVYYLPEAGPARQIPFGPVTVPEGEYWMMGDSRNNSADSRAAGHGPIPEENVIGKARLIVLPFDRFGWLGSTDPQTATASAGPGLPDGLPLGLGMMGALPFALGRRRMLRARAEAERFLPAVRPPSGWRRRS
ncbi:signal peptidase I [Pseudonocardia sp. NPDC049635]|uniref:signal peptidase I n=1 Tax=Pseudonocardia sp. NPDC049635 TaxID=3155506 RepID=UPI0033C5C6C3